MSMRAKINNTGCIIPCNPNRGTEDGGFPHLEVAYGLLQRAVVVQHHASELERLDVVLVQHEGFLEALHR